MILYLLRKKKLREAPLVAYLFAAFILSCGFGHALEAVIFWKPVYRFAGLVKVCTALVSWATVAALVPFSLKMIKRSDSLITSEQFEDGAFSHATMGMAHVALDGRILRVNDALCKIWELSRAVILSPAFKWQSITPEPDLSIDLSHLEQLLQGVTIRDTMVKRYRRPAGSSTEFKYVQLTVWRVHDASGAVAYFAISVIELGFAKGITKALEALDRAQEDLDAE